MQNKHGKDLLKPVINMIYEYTRIHFQIEEDFHKKLNFPELKRHHELHNELTQKLNKISKKSIWDEDPYEFLEFLKKWWIDHICEEDRLFADFLHKKTS
jgi:hemerythrin